MAAEGVKGLIANLARFYMRQYNTATKAEHIIGKYGRRGCWEVAAACSRLQRSLRAHRARRDRESWRSNRLKPASRDDVKVVL